jgi:hypothetical protein
VTGSLQSITVAVYFARVFGAGTVETVSDSKAAADPKLKLGENEK